MCHRLPNCTTKLQEWWGQEPQHGVGVGAAWPQAVLHLPHAPFSRLGLSSPLHGPASAATNSSQAFHQLCGLWRSSLSLPDLIPRRQRRVPAELVRELGSALMLVLPPQGKAVAEMTACSRGVGKRTRRRRLLMQGRSTSDSSPCPPTQTATLSTQYMLTA